jgi:hypothetical protein
MVSIRDHVAGAPAPSEGTQVWLGPCKGRSYCVFCEDSKVYIRRARLARERSSHRCA